MADNSLKVYLAKLHDSMREWSDVISVVAVFEEGDDMVHWASDLPLLREHKEQEEMVWVTERNFVRLPRGFSW